MWSLLDNFEWMMGTTEHFGLHYVNFSDPERPRTPKESAAFYRSIIENNGFRQPDVTHSNTISSENLTSTLGSSTDSTEQPFNFTSTTQSARTGTELGTESSPSTVVSNIIVLTDTTTTVTHTTDKGKSNNAVGSVKLNSGILLIILMSIFVLQFG